MPWVLADEQHPDAMGPPAPQYALGEGVHPDALQQPPEADQPWYQKIMAAASAGFRHRFADVASEREAFNAENPVMAGVRNAMPFGLGEYIPNSAVRPGAQQTLSGLVSGQTPGVGPTERAAHAATVSHDQADKAAGVGEGFLPALAYGAGESPEMLLAPEARLMAPGSIWRGAVNAALTGGGIGAADAGANDRNALQGAALGVAGGVTGKAIGGALGKVFNTVRGRWEDAGLQAADRASAAQGVNLRVGDLAPESAFRKFEDIAKFVPGSGAPAEIKNQAQALGENVTRLQDQLAQPIARQLSAGLSPEQIVVKGARDALATHESTARAMFEAVPKDVAVDPHTFTPALRELSDEYPNLLASVDAPTSIRRKVGAMLNPESALSDEDRTALEIVRSSGLPSHAQSQAIDQLIPGGAATIAKKMADASALNAGEAHWIQSGLGDLQRALDAQTAGGARLGSAGRLVTKARGALLDDIGNVDNGQLAAARKYFAENVVPYRDDTMLRKLVGDDATAGDRLFENIGPNDVGKAKLLMRSLTPEGQDALRYGFISRAGNRAVNDNFASGLSTARIRKGFDVGNQLNQNRQLAEIFTPAQQEQITGIRDTAQYADRSSTWAHNPHTGAQNLPLNLAKLAGGAIGGSMLHLSAPAAVLGPVAAARAVTAASSSPLFKRAYFAGGGTGADSVLEAMLANAAAARGEPSVLDYMGSP